MNRVTGRNTVSRSPVRTHLNIISTFTNLQLTNHLFNPLGDLCWNVPHLLRLCVFPSKQQKPSSTVLSS
jgi:hypothetical protein